MGPRVVGVEAHHPGCGREGGVRGVLITRRPCVGDVVGLTFLVVPDQGVSAEGLLGRGDRLEFLVVDIDQREGVAGDVGMGGDDRRDLLALEPNLVGGKNGLRVARQSRHPGQPVRRQSLTGNDRQHAVEGHRFRGVDGHYPGMSHGGPQDSHVQHAGKGEVVEIVAGAPDEPVVLLAKHRVADPAHLGAGA